MGQMKNFRQLIKELPSSTIVVTEGTFNPPTAKNELQFKLVEKLVAQNKAEHVVYVSESVDGLSFNRKTHFLNLMFGKVNFEPLKGSLNEQVANLKTKYKNVIVIGDSIKGKLAESVEVINYHEDHTKVKSIVSKGDYTSFKNLMPTSFRDIDCKIMFNEMRQASGLEHIKEDFKFTVDKLREKYFKGEIYQIGDIVESAGQQYEIMDRGSNYLVLVDNRGDLSRKWVKDVSLVEAVKKATGPLKKACWKGYTAVGLKMKNGRKVPNCVPESVLDPRDVHKDYTEKSKTLQDLSRNKDVDQKHVQQRRLDLDKEYSKHKLKEDTDTQVSYKGYTTSNFHHAPDLAKAFKLAAVDAKDPVAMLNAVKTTDAYLDIHNLKGDNPTIDQVKNWKHAHIKAKDALQKIGVFHKNQVQYEEAGYKINTLAETIDFGKYSTQNVAQSAKSYQSVMKWARAAMVQAVDDKQIKNTLDPNVSQQVDDLQDWPFEPQTKTGFTLAVRDHHRRQKVKYVTEGGEVGDQDTKVVKVKNIPMSNDIIPKDDSTAPGSMKRPSNALFAGDEPKKKTVKKENSDIDFNTFKNYRLQRQDK
jgi:hypothetical protein